MPTGYGLRPADQRSQTGSRRPRLKYSPLGVSWLSGPAWHEGVDTYERNEIVVRITSPAKTVAETRRQARVGGVGGLVSSRCRDAGDDGTLGLRTQTMRELPYRPFPESAVVVGDRPPSSGSHFSVFIHSVPQRSSCCAPGGGPPTGTDRIAEAVVSAYSAVSQRSQRFRWGGAARPSACGCSPARSCTNCA